VDHNFCCVKALERLELKLSLLSNYRFRKKTSSPPSEAGITLARPLCLGLLCHQSLELVGSLRRFTMLSVEFFRLLLTVFFSGKTNKTSLRRDA
jgi:hypothetical protein